MTVERVEEDESMRDAYFRREVGADGRIVLGRSLRRGLLASRQSRTAKVAEERRDCIMAAIDPARGDKDDNYSEKVEKAFLRHNVRLEAALSKRKFSHNLFFLGFDGGNPAKHSSLR